MTTGSDLRGMAEREVDAMVKRLARHGSADEIADEEMTRPAMALTDAGGGRGSGELPEEVAQAREVKLAGWASGAQIEPGPPPPCPNPYLRPGLNAPRAWASGRRLWVAPLSGDVEWLRAVAEPWSREAIEADWEKMMEDCKIEP
ncbi:MAG: hypothetical protein NC484_09365 [Alloprevotella sp.]|nr:hypothetical protein [Alloprevotella sp.]